MNLFQCCFNGNKKDHQNYEFEKRSSKSVSVDIGTLPSSTDSTLPSPTLFKAEQTLFQALELSKEKISIEYDELELGPKMAEGGAAIIHLARLHSPMNHSSGPQPSSSTQPFHPPHPSSSSATANITMSHVQNSVPLDSGVSSESTASMGVRDDSKAMETDSRIVVAKILKEPPNVNRSRIKAAFEQEVAIMWVMSKHRYAIQFIAYVRSPMTFISRHYVLGSLSQLIYLQTPSQSPNILVSIHSHDNQDTIHSHDEGDSGEHVEKDGDEAWWVSASKEEMKRKREIRYDVGLVLDLSTDIICGITEMHAIGIVHNDLKPANVLLDTSPDEKGGDLGNNGGIGGGRIRAVLCDFGIASVVGTPVAGIKSLGESTARGASATYAAPEVFEKMRTPKTQYQPSASCAVASVNRNDKVGIDGSVDVYAFGIMLFEMMSRSHPWKPLKTSAEIESAVCKGTRPSISPHLSVLIQTEPSYSFLASTMEICWLGDPSLRPSSDTLAKTFKVYKRGLNK